MNNKRWVIIFVVCCICFTGIVEALYNVKSLWRNRTLVDNLVNHVIPGISDTQVRALLLSDSVTLTAVAPKMLKEDVIDLTSVAPVTIVGNYFMLKRFLKKNPPPQAVYFFTIPELYQFTLQGSNQLYFETVFTDPDEIDELRKVNHHFYKTTLTLNQYFEIRRNRLWFIREDFRPVRTKHTLLNLDSIKNDLDERSDLIDQRIKSYMNDNDKLDSLLVLYLNRLVDLCNEEGIQLHIVIAPAPDRLLRLFYTSRWYDYLKKTNVRLHDINEYYKFAEHHFVDGLHVFGIGGDIYVQLIDEKILPILEY